MKGGKFEKACDELLKAVERLKPSQKLTVTVKASDRYNLSTGPHVGVGDSYQLDVVAPDELLAHLEARSIRPAGRAKIG